MKRGLAAVMIVSIVLSLFVIFTPKAIASENVIFQDNFESYAVGTFPSSGGWQLVYNGAGDQYQVVTDSYAVSGTKSLQMMGTDGWSALVTKDFSSSSNIIGYEAYLMAFPGAWPSVAFFNAGIVQWGRPYGNVGVDTIGGYIEAGASGQELQPCTANTWYKIDVVMDRNARTFNVSVNDVLEGISIPEPNNPWEIQSLRFDVGWENALNYFDDVKVFEVPSSPNLLVNPGFEDGLNGWSTSVGTAVYSVDSTTSVSGSFSAKGVETNTGSLGRLLQDVTNRVSAGDQIQISGWIKTANVTGQVVIGLGYVDANGVYPLDDIFGEEKYEIGYVTGTQDWGFYQSPVFTLGPMPIDAVGLAFLFDFNNGAGTAWWDGVSLVSLSLSPVQSSTSVSCSPNPALVGSSITCTATVFGSNPTGTVTWTTSSSTGNFSQFICTLSNGTCSTTYVDSLAGSVTIAASYSGDSNNPPSSGSSILIVTPSGPIYYSANYTSVQTTIDAAPPGATVIIAAGFYTESLIIDKPLTIIGERDLPVFSGGASAIYLILESGASGSIVTGIEITNWLWGIVIDNVSNVSIYGNVMASIGGSGIVLEGNSATDNSIYGNVFMDVPTPINLTASPGNNNIYGNAFVSETNVAINVGASGNSIYGNTIVGNEIVLNLTGSNSNAVYHNNFVSTTQITVLASGNNTWDTGLPSGGNYWSTTPNIVGGNNTDHFPLTQPFTLIAGHYVGVACVVVSKPVIAQGFSINLTTCLINKGEYAQTFNVTAYANTTAIGLQAVNNLNATGLSILTFKWNTTGLIYGNYMISAYAQPVAGQNDTSGDTFTLGTVKVTIPGDISGDFKVSLADLVLLANAYGSKPGEARWNPNADINDKGVVGLSDLVLLANHYGQHYP